MKFGKLSALALASVLGASMFVMGGCASNNTTNVEASSASEQAQEPALLEIGNPEDAIGSIEVANETESAITSVLYAETGTSDYVDLPFADAAEWASGESAVLNVPSLAADETDSAAATAGEVNAASAATDADEASAAGDDVMLRDQIDLRFFTADDAMYELHGIALEGISEASLKIDPESNLAYLEYVGESGAEESTLATEKAYVEQKRAQEEAAAAAEAAAAQAAAEEQARAAAAASQQNSGQASKSTPSGTASGSGGSSKSSPSYSSPSGGNGGGSSTPAPSQSEDQCVEGGVAFRD